MEEISEDLKYDRRSFLRNAAMTIAAAQFAAIGSATAQSQNTNPKSASASNTSKNSLGRLKQIDAGLLNVGYAEAGPADGRPVILLHGWPYDIHSFVDVAPLLAAKGYRSIIPHVRRYGTTRFVSSDTLRNGQPSVVALDAIAGLFSAFSFVLTACAVGKLQL
jgi:hypothetical protein